MQISLCWVPSCVFQQTNEGSNKAEMFQVLYENWIAANGKWDQSQIVVQCRSTVKGSKTGARRWMLRSDIVSKYGSESVANDIINAKLNDPMLKQTCVRDHPDLPGRSDLQLFLCWDSSHECDTEDTVVEQMFTMSQKHDLREGQGKKNKGHGHDKKRKRSTSSSSSVNTTSMSISSDSDSDSDDSSSSGAKKKSKKSKNNKKAKKGKDAGKKAKKTKEDKKGKKERKDKDKEKDAEKEKERTAAEEEKKRLKEKKAAEKEAEKQRKKEEREEKQKKDKEKNDIRAKGRKAHYWV